MEAIVGTMDASARTTPTKTAAKKATMSPPRSSSNTPSHTNSDSRTSSNSELEREIAYMSLGGTTNGCANPANGSTGSVAESNGSGGGGGGIDNASTTSASTAGLSNATTTTTSSTGGATDKGASGNNGTIKKRVSSSRTTPAVKARRIRFYRNGDRFYAGIVLAVSAERYRSFESLVEDLTRLMEERISGAVRNIYTTAGKRIASLDEIEDGLECVCLCNKETFKKLEYAAQPNKQANRLSRHLRAGSPHINGSGSGGSLLTTVASAAASPHTNGGGAGAGAATSAIAPIAQCVHPRIVTLIRNGTKPRKVLRLLLNKRNSPSFDHVLTAITQCVKLDSGCVRKVFTLGGVSVQQLADFFGTEAVFFAYGTERVQPDDFRLEGDEQRAVAQTRRTIGRNGATAAGPKPKMPVKNSVNLHNTTYDAGEADALLAELDDSESCAASTASAAEAAPDAHGELPEDVPERIDAEYLLGPVVGDGNFAVVLRIVERSTGRPFALKIIDKSKCKGKEHYIDAEVRVMKKLRHPHIMALIFDVDTPTKMFLVLEYVSGKWDYNYCFGIINHLRLIAIQAAISSTPSPRRRVSLSRTPAS